jgi:hypothetical protein
LESEEETLYQELLNRVTAVEAACLAVALNEMVEFSLKIGMHVNWRPN